MDELPYLLAMILTDSKIAGNITLGRVKLAYGINCGLKNIFLSSVWDMLLAFVIGYNIGICRSFVLTNGSIIFLIRGSWIRIYFFIMRLLIVGESNMLGHHLWYMVMLKLLWRIWKESWLKHQLKAIRVISRQLKS